MPLYFTAEVEHWSVLVFVCLLPSLPTPNNTTICPKLPGPIGCAISSDPCPCLGRGITSARGRRDCLFVTLNWLSMDSTVIEESVVKTLYKMLLFWCSNLSRGITVMWQESPWGAGLQGKEYHREYGMPCEGIPMGRSTALLLTFLPTPPQHRACTVSSTLADARESNSVLKGLCGHGHSHLSAD